MGVRVVAVKCDKTYIIEDFKPELKNEQAFVGGLIEMLDIASNSSGYSISLICNEEGKLLGLPLNKPLININGVVIDCIVGDCLIALFNADGEMVSMPKKLANKYVNYIRRYKVIPYSY